MSWKQLLQNLLNPANLSLRLIAPLYHADEMLILSTTRLPHPRLIARCADPASLQSRPSIRVLSALAFVHASDSLSFQLRYFWLDCVFGDDQHVPYRYIG